jgi:hypothetical protein
VKDLARSLSRAIIPPGDKVMTDTIRSRPTSIPDDVEESALETVKHFEDNPHFDAQQYLSDFWRNAWEVAYDGFLKVTGREPTELEMLEEASYCSREILIIKHNADQPGRGENVIRLPPSLRLVVDNDADDKGDT